MNVQEVSGRNPTEKSRRTNTAKGNAVAGVKARNGAEKIGPRKRTGVRNTAVRPALASALTAVLDREGMVLAIVAGRAPARAFLRGGCL